MATVEDLLPILESVNGAGYRWYNGYPGEWEGPPEYMGGDASGYTANDVKYYGTNCSGLFNWGLQQLGLPAVGGTYAFAEAIGWNPIDPNWQEIYPAGYIAVGIGGAQGHMAMLTSDPSGQWANNLIQASSYNYLGVTEQFYLWNQQPYLWNEGTHYQYVGPMPGLDL